MAWQADRVAAPSWGWRLVHMLWVVPAIVGAGLFTWCGFLYIGTKARNRRWLALAAAWLLYAVVAGVLVAPHTGQDQPVPFWPATYVAVGYFAGIVSTLMAVPAWWRWRAQHSPAVWTAHPSFPPGSEVNEPPPAPVTLSSLPVGFEVPGLGVVEGQPETASGAFGTVYRIRRDFDGKPVAGKLFTVPRGAFGQMVAERSLRDEVGVLESLHHPNIVRVMNPVALGEGGTWMAISEWIEGSTLESAAYGIEPMSLDEVGSVGRQLLSALVHLEERGVVHRDIKPANVMVDQSGTVKLIDFNLTRPIGRETALAGTAPYLPADHLGAGSTVDSMVDRYGAGVVLFELVVGKHPYHEYELSGFQILPDSIPVDPRAVRPEITVGLAQFLSRAVQGHEADRFPSANAMLQAWEAAVGTGVTNATALEPER